MVDSEGILKGLAERARALRVFRQLRQEELAERAGVGVMTVRRFEKTGRASIENVLRIAFALRAEAGFESLFEAPKYRTLDEALAEPDVRRVQRVRSPK
ncbi:MAG: helix-turn-helix domain-containing protein [Myxococcaceae bacterium]